MSFIRKGNSPKPYFIYMTDFFDDNYALLAN